MMPNHGGPPPAHLVGPPQVGLAPQIQAAHYPTIIQTTIMTQQEQLDQQIPESQQIHQQVYHYQQDIQQIPQNTMDIFGDAKQKTTPQMAVPILFGI